MSVVVEAGGALAEAEGAAAEVRGTPAEVPQACYNCGTCSAGCPVTERRPEFFPRRIVRLSALRLEECLLEDPTLWLCSDCHLCAQRCPQGIDIPHLITQLRNRATAAGKVHPSYLAQLAEIASTGRVYEVDEFENENRESLGLPPLLERPLDAESEFWGCLFSGLNARARGGVGGDSG